MTPDEMRDVLALVNYPGYQFEILERSQDGHPGPCALFLRAFYTESDIVTKEPTTQYTRPWQLSRDMVKSELVQTALKCALTSAEHRVREHFLYRGQRIFGPHFDVDALYEIARAKRLDYRGK